MKRPKDIWKGSYVLRGGTYKDKFKNVHKEPVTYRNPHTGIVVDSRGNFLGYEKTGNHYYSSDPNKQKKPSTFVRPNQITALKSRSGHIRKLR